jgi:hypothetical protein
MQNEAAGSFQDSETRLRDIISHNVVGTSVSQNVSYKINWEIEIQNGR